jgi:hypothetical protein
VTVSKFTTEARDPTVLVDRLSALALGEPLPPGARTAVINAVTGITQASHGNDYLNARVKQAGYLVFSAPQFQLIR